MAKPSPQTHPQVFILIPTHNRAPILEKCLRALDQQSYRQYEVVVINDGSSDETSSVIAKHKHTAEIKGDGNLWWTGAMRLGADYALEKSKMGDYVLLMNDDTSFGPKYLVTIVSQSINANRAIVASAAYDQDNPGRVIESGVKVNWQQGHFIIPLKPPKDSGKSSLVPVDTACGRGALIPVEVFQKLGNLSPRLPHYLSDYEFILRAHQAGFPTFISYQSKVFATAKPGGIKFIPGKKVTLKQLYLQAFSRRSKSNLRDILTFILLRCPPRHLPSTIYFYLKNIAFRVSFINP